jgi:hypothetical protein
MMYETKGGRYLVLYPCVDWIHLPQHRDQWQIFVNTVEQFVQRMYSDEPPVVYGSRQLADLLKQGRIRVSTFSSVANIVLFDMKT